MAVRKAFMPKFNKMMDDLSVEMTLAAEALGNHKELLKLPKHLHDNFVSCTVVSKYGCKILEINQNVALQSVQRIYQINLKNKVFIAQPEMTFYVKESQSVIDIQKFLDKEVEPAAKEIRVSLDSYKTYKQALIALPWIEDLHPDKNKEKGCVGALVPIDTINKVNALMGVK